MFERVQFSQHSAYLVSEEQNELDGNSNLEEAAPGWHGII